MHQQKPGSRHREPCPRSRPSPSFLPSVGSTEVRRQGQGRDPPPSAHLLWGPLQRLLSPAPPPPHPGTQAWGGGQCSGWGKSGASPLPQKGSCVQPLFSEPFSFFIASGILQCRGPKPLQSKHMKNSPQPILNIYGFS